MRYASSAAAMVLLGFGAIGLAGEGEAAKGAAPVNGLPFKKQITWDDKLFSADPDAVTLVKTTSDLAKGEVVWVLELKSDDAVRRFQTAAAYNPVVQNFSGRYRVVFYDADRVAIARVPLRLTGHFAKGERVRVTLDLPDANDEGLKITRFCKVVLERD